MSVEMMTTGVFVLLGALIAVHTLATLRSVVKLQQQDPTTHRWRAVLLLIPILVAGYLGAQLPAMFGSGQHSSFLLGTLCLLSAAVVNLAALTHLGLRETREREQLEARLQHSATHDPLTGLPNRGLFVNRLSRVLDFRSKRQPQRIFSVLYVDIDRFKLVNDSLGYSIGDRLLRVTAERLGQCIRATDTLARLGGNEFVILLDDIVDVRDAVRVADRIREVLVPSIRIDEHELFAASSVGIVLSESGYQDPDDVLRDADIAMYRAKTLGGSRYEIFDSAMRERVTDRLSMENELRQAIERDEFRLAYQPIIDLATDKLVGFEALVRWQHPRRGLVSPFHFIDFAEKTGQIIAIDRWVLREACRQMKEWQVRLPMDTPLLISTNLSSKQFTQPDLISCITGVLEETGLDVSCLEVELTENAFIENLEPIKVTLDQLKSLGVGLKLDDFGTGYSSLSYLHQLPFDFLKIDRSFVMNMAECGTDLAIVHTVLLLAQALGIRVVAEGVETPQQLLQLKGFNCEFAQGYLFSKPVLPGAAEEIILRANAGAGMALTTAG